MSMDTRSRDIPFRNCTKGLTGSIKLLVMEDAPVVREFLVYILGADPGHEPNIGKNIRRSG